MTCPVNHEQMTTKYCIECGAEFVKPVVDTTTVATTKPVDEAIAEQLNEIAAEVIKETGLKGIYRKNYEQTRLFLEKIIQRKLIIPDGMVFVIATNPPPNHIITMSELYETYPFLHDVDINSLIVNEPNDDKKLCNAHSTTNFARMHSFLIANGEYKNGKFFNIKFDKIANTLKDDDAYKRSGLPLSVLLDGSYYESLEKFDELVKMVEGFNLSDKRLVKFITNQLVEKFA